MPSTELSINVEAKSLADKFEDIEFAAGKSLSEATAKTPKTGTMLSSPVSEDIPR